MIFAIRILKESYNSLQQQSSYEWSVNLQIYLLLSNYSSVPNKRTGWNFDKNQISVQGGILIKILECRVKTGNKRDS